MGMEKIENEDFHLLCQAFLTLKTPEECAHFLEDLCSIAEMTEMSKRMRAAVMLRHNQPYAEIIEKTGLSTATISRVNKCIKYGQDGYVTVLNEMEKNGELK